MSALLSGTLQAKGCIKAMSSQLNYALNLLTKLIRKCSDAENFFDAVKVAREQCISVRFHHSLNKRLLDY